MLRIPAIVLIVIFISAQAIIVSAETPDYVKKGEQLSKREMQSIVEYISHDLFEGRAPGTRGSLMAETYIQSLFKLLNFDPVLKNKQYLQPFKLAGFTTERLEVTIGNTRIHFPDAIVGGFYKNKKRFEISGKPIFIGFGTVAEKWHWDDFKGTDINNRIVFVRVNDPGHFNDAIFEGKVLTYFGRWTYHIEEATRRGAKAVFLIHTTETAGYDWRVVKNSWAGENIQLNAILQNNLQFSGWIKESVLKKILSKQRISLDNLYNASLKRSFKPIEMDCAVRISGRNRFRTILNQNVIAKIPGKSNREIVLSAHLDHLGKVDNGREDGIFNGALDNGTAVASMILVAKILKAHQKDLNYTITLLACNAEESGLLGSFYYVKNRDRSNIVANINFESTPVWQASDSIMGIGARFSTFEDILKSVSKQMGIGYSEFSMSNQGFFYRSDQYSFARFGIPSIWISSGEKNIDGKERYKDFWRNTYHTVKDEYSASWSMEGMRQTIVATLRVIDFINRSKSEPKWKNNLTFPLIK